MTAHTIEIDDGVGTCPESASAWRFRLVMLRHYRRVYGMAAAMLGDAAEAEDVTQEAFTRYWQQSQQIEKPGHWLMRVAHNACLDRLRRAGRIVSDDGRPEPASAAGDDPARQYEHGETAARLREHVDALPEPQRSLIVLFDMRGCTGADCAAILGINENQVKVYLHRARRKLRDALERDDD